MSVEITASAKNECVPPWLALGVNSLTQYFTFGIVLLTCFLLGLTLEVEERLGLFQTLTNDVAILSRNLEADVVAIQRTGDLCRCAAAHERVEHYVTFVAP